MHALHGSRLRSYVRGTDKVPVTGNTIREAGCDDSDEYVRVAVVFFIPTTGEYLLGIAYCTYP